MLNFKEHILTRIKKTYAMLGVVARCISVDAFIWLYKTLIMSQIWNPFRQCLVDKIKSVQKKATRFDQHMQLPALQRNVKVHRRRMNLIELCNMILEFVSGAASPVIKF